MARWALVVLLAGGWCAADVRIEAGALVVVADAQARLMALQVAGENLIARPQPLASVTKGGRRWPATALSGDAQRWRLSFGDSGVTVEVALSVAGDQLDLSLAQVNGAPDEVVFAELALAPGATTLGAGLLALPKQVVGLVAANPATLVRASVGRSASVTSAAGRSEPGFAGCRAALLAAPRERIAAAVAQAEARFGTPLGVRAKQAEANRGSYLMIHGVTPANAAQVIDWAKRGRFGAVLLIHGNWASFAHNYAVPKEYFPGGLPELKRVVDQFHAAGILVGAHCFATKIPKSADRVHPVPDRRLYQDLSTTLAADVAAEAKDLPTADALTAWPRPVGTRDLLIDDEIITYETCVDGPPGTFRNCQRGAYGTRPAAHRAGARVGHLFTDESRGIWVVDPQTSLLDEHTQALADTYNGAGFDWIYFDGAEDVPPPHWYYFSVYKLAVLKKLHRPPAVVESAARGPFCWHLDTRTGQCDYYWVSRSAKGEADDAVARAVPAARQLFMVPDIGWFPINGPRGGRGPKGFTRLDDIEYVFGRALATDSVVAVLCTVDGLREHPQWDAALDIIGRYERWRLDRRLDEPTRALLLREGRDAMMVVDEAGRERIVGAREYTSVGHFSDTVRAYRSAEATDGVLTSSVFGTGRPVNLVISLDPRRVQVLDHLHRPLTIEQRPGAVLVLPLRNRVILKTRGIDTGELLMAMEAGRVEPLPLPAIWLPAEAATKVEGTLALVPVKTTEAGGPVFGKVLVPTAPARTEGPCTGYATYTVNVPTAGRWLLHARLWNRDTNSNSFYFVPPDGEPRVLGNVIGDYEYWAWQPPLSLELPAGPYTFRIGTREARPNESPLLSLLCLVPAGDATPPTDADARAALSAR